MLSATKELTHEYPHVKFSVERLEEVAEIERQEITTIHVKSVNRSNFSDALFEYLGDRDITEAPRVVALLNEYIKDEDNN